MDLYEEELQDFEVEEADYFDWELFSQADKVYDIMRMEKVFILPGMDCYTEFREAIPVVRRALITKRNPIHKTLDEWANELCLSVSEVIELLAQARYVKERGALNACHL